MIFGQHWDDAKRKEVQELIEKGVPTDIIVRMTGTSKNSVRDEKWRMTPLEKRGKITAYLKRKPR